MAGILDGVTILRFIKAFESGGGIEQHIQDLDETILERNSSTIIKLYLDKEKGVENIRFNEIGKGCSINIPIFVTEQKKATGSSYITFKKSINPIIKRIICDYIIYNPILYWAIFRFIIKKIPVQTGQYPIKNAGKIVKDIIEKYDINLLVMHHIGTVDSFEIINVAKELNLPFIYINHFANSLFSNLSIREQLKNAAKIAGLTNVEVPRWIKKKIYIVSNAIDLNIFNPIHAAKQTISSEVPIIICPARIIENKGQKDLIKAYINLKKEGLESKIIFVGRTDSFNYENELKKIIQINNLLNDFLFLGELTQEELRDLYAISSIMAFPTYHKEGLPRVLIEAQAMKIPPVSYITGGTPGAMIDGKTGFLVPKGNVDQFSKKLRVLLTNESIRFKMGIEGRKYVIKRFNLVSLAENHEKLYATVLKKIFD